MEFKEILKKLRNEKKITQQQLADELHISRSVVAKWETGLALPSEESSKLLVEYFGVEREKLFQHAESDTVIVGKNREISGLKKAVVILSLALAVSFVTITLLGIFGLKGSKKAQSPPPVVSEESVYFITINNEDQIKSTYNEKTGTYRFENIGIDRHDYVCIFKEGYVIPFENYRGAGGTATQTGAVLFFQEGVYDLEVKERIDLNHGTFDSATVEFDRVDSLYRSVQMFFVDDAKSSQSLVKTNGETKFSEYKYTWYLENVSLEEGDKIYFFVTTEKRNYGLEGYEGNNCFETFGDYVLVKETHVYSELRLVLEYDENKIVIHYSYELSPI